MESYTTVEMINKAIEFKTEMLQEDGGGGDPVNIVTNATPDANLSILSNLSIKPEVIEMEQTLSRETITPDMTQETSKDSKTAPEESSNSINKENSNLLVSKLNESNSSQLKSINLEESVPCSNEKDKNNSSQLEPLVNGDKNVDPVSNKVIISNMSSTSENVNTRQNVVNTDVLQKSSPRDKQKDSEKGLGEPVENSNESQQNQLNSNKLPDTANVLIVEEISELSSDDEDINMQSDTDDMKELRKKYLPFLDGVIRRLKADKKNSVSVQQLQKLEALQIILNSRNEKYSNEYVENCKVILENLYRKAAILQLPVPKTIKLENTDEYSDCGNSEPALSIVNIKKERIPNEPMQTIDLSSDDEAEVVTNESTKLSENEPPVTIKTEVTPENQSAMKDPDLIDVSDDDSIDFTEVQPCDVVVKKEKPDEVTLIADSSHTLSNDKVIPSVDAGNNSSEITFNGEEIQTIENTINSHLLEKETVGETPLIFEKDNDSSLIHNEGATREPINCLASTLNSEQTSKTIAEICDGEKTVQPTLASTEICQTNKTLNSNETTIPANPEPITSDPPCKEAKEVIVKKEIFEEALQRLRMCAENDPIELSDSDTEMNAAGNTSNSPVLDLEELAEKPAEELIPIWLKMAEACGIKPTIVNDIWGSNIIQTKEEHDNENENGNGVTSDNSLDNFPPLTEYATNDGADANLRSDSISPSFSPALPEEESNPKTKISFKSVKTALNSETILPSMPPIAGITMQFPPVIKNQPAPNTAPPMVSFPSTNIFPVINNNNNINPFYGQPNIKDPRLKNRIQLNAEKVPDRNLNYPHSNMQSTQPLMPRSGSLDNSMMESPKFTPMAEIYNQPYSSNQPTEGKHMGSYNPFRSKTFQQRPINPKRDPELYKKFNIKKKELTPKKFENNPSGFKIQNVSSMKTPVLPKPPSESVMDKIYRTNDFDSNVKKPLGFTIPKKINPVTGELSVKDRLKSEFKLEYYKLGRKKNGNGTVDDPEIELNDYNIDSRDYDMGISPEGNEEVEKRKFINPEATKSKGISSKPKSNSKKGKKKTTEQKPIAKKKPKSSLELRSSSDSESNEVEDDVFDLLKEKSKTTKSKRSKEKNDFAEMAETFKLMKNSSNFLPMLQLLFGLNQLMSGNNLDKFQKALKLLQNGGDVGDDENPKKRKRGKSQKGAESKQTKKSSETKGSNKSPNASKTVEKTPSYKVISDNEDESSVKWPKKPQIAKKRFKMIDSSDFCMVDYDNPISSPDDDSDLTDYCYDYPQKRATVQKRVKALLHSSIEPALILTRCDESAAAPLLIPWKEVPLNESEKRNKKKSVVNTDRSCHYRSSYVDKCVICRKQKDDIVSHYVNDHKGSEVFISRLSQKDINNIENRPYHFSDPSKCEAKCVFCREYQSHNLRNWHEHLSEHTGEYAYQCSGCEIVAPKKMSMLFHCRNECEYEARVNKIYHFDPDSNKIDLFVCNLCNYVQLYRENIIQHLKTEHELNKFSDSDCKVILIFKSLYFGENDSPKPSEVPSVNISNSIEKDPKEKLPVNESLNQISAEDNRMQNVETNDIEMVANDDTYIVNFEDNTNIVEIKIEPNRDQNEQGTSASHRETRINVIPISNLCETRPNVGTGRLTHNPIETVIPEILPVVKIENAMDIDEECSSRASVVFDGFNAGLINENASTLNTTSSIINANNTLQSIGLNEPVVPESQTEFYLPEPEIPQETNGFNEEETEVPEQKPIVTPFNVLSRQEVCLKPWAMHSYNTVYKKPTDLCKQLEKNFIICMLFKCPKKDCIFTTDSSSSYRDHLSTHDYVSLECPYCNTKDPKSFLQLIEHIETHKTDIYQCSNCFYRSCAAYNVYLHQNMYHYQDADRKIYLCLNHASGTGMSREESLSRIEDIIESRTKNVSAVKCKHCPQSYYVKSSLISHLRAAHKTDGTDPVFNSVGIFVCLNCGYETDYIWNIRRHLMQHHPQKLTIVSARLTKETIKQNSLGSTMLINVAESVAEKLIALPPKDGCTNLSEYSTMEENFRFARSSFDLRKNQRFARLFTENFRECFMNFDGTDVGLKENNVTFRRLLDEDRKSGKHLKLTDLYQFINPILEPRGYPESQLYTCCDNYHASAEAYFVHLQTKAHNKGLMIKCNQCVGHYDIAFLRNHILLHRKPRYICFACGYFSATADAAQSHYTACHIKMKGKLRCVVVTATNIFEAFLNDENENGNDCYYIINHEAVTLSRQKFMEFIIELFERQCEGSLINNPVTGTMITLFPNGVNIPKFITTDIRFACSICGLDRNNFEELKTHLKEEHVATNQDYECHHCKTVVRAYAANFYRLKRHIELHGVNVYQCCLCHYFHHDKDILLTHCKYFHTTSRLSIFTHFRRGKGIAKEHFEVLKNNENCDTNSQPSSQVVDCPICKEFIPDDYDKFLAHLRFEHSITESYKCGYCEKQFDEMNLIQAHIKSAHSKKTLDIRLIFSHR